MVLLILTKLIISILVSLFTLHSFLILLIQFETVSLTWTKPSILGILPSRRRAHTTILHGNHLILFGGGNGVNALNDVHTLNVSKLDKLEWSELEVGGKKPIARGYHTMDLVGNKCLVFGGSDGAECFADVHVLDLGMSDSFLLLARREANDFSHVRRNFNVVRN